MMDTGRRPVELSIITVLYGGLQTLLQTLPSWSEALRGLQVELVIIDNTPGEDVQEFVADCLGSAVSIYVHNSTNVGFAAAANQGAEVASGRLLLFLNADVYLTGEAMREVLDAAPTISVSALRLRTAGTSFEGIERTWYGFLSDRKVGSSRVCLGPSGGGGLFTRDLFLDMGGFHPRFFAWGEDAALALLLRAAAVKTATLPTELEHVGGHSVASTHGQRVKARLLIRNRIWTFRFLYGRREKCLYGVAFATAVCLNSMRKIRSRTIVSYLLGVRDGLSTIPPDVALLANTRERLKKDVPCSDTR